MKTCVLKLVLLLKQRLIERGLGDQSLSSYDPSHSGPRLRELGPTRVLLGLAEGHVVCLLQLPAPARLCLGQASAVRDPGRPTLKRVVGNFGPEPSRPLSTKPNTQPELNLAVVVSCLTGAAISCRQTLS